MLELGIWLMEDGLNFLLLSLLFVDALQLWSLVFWKLGDIVQVLFDRPENLTTCFQLLKQHIVSAVTRHNNHPFICTTSNTRENILPNTRLNQKKFMNKSELKRQSCSTMLPPGEVQFYCVSFWIPQNELESVTSERNLSLVRGMSLSNPVTWSWTSGRRLMKVYDIVGENQDRVLRWSVDDSSFFKFNAERERAWYGFGLKHSSLSNLDTWNTEWRSGSTTANC